MKILYSQSSLKNEEMDEIQLLPQKLAHWREIGSYGNGAEDKNAEPRVAFFDLGARRKTKTSGRDI